MDLFDDTASSEARDRMPLAARMRPRELEDIVGQDHILGPGRLLRRAIEADRLSSVILYGPPGCGKTSLAEVIAAATARHFARTSGVTANVAELRDLMRSADHRRQRGGTDTILFIDEIHRFNKAQQDVLLPHVEHGAFTLVGATTHNPLFFINTPLVSRSLIFELKPLSCEAIAALVTRALTDERGLAAYKATLADDAIEHLARVCEGDARRALNALEIAVMTTPPAAGGGVVITRAAIEDSVQKKAVVYDRDEDGHYDTISAFIKSVRGSDPDAAIYWLAKMLHAGEDPRFLARRLVILASEDIGNADPRGLSLAVSAMHASEFVGMPEARIILSQATTYLATAPKSNAAYKAVDAAMADVREGRTVTIPAHLKNKTPPVEGQEEAEYIYPHDLQDHFAVQEYAGLARAYYEPTDQGYEATIGKRLAWWRKLRADARDSQAADGGERQVKAG